MPFDNNGVFARLPATVAIPGQIIASEPYNDGQDDIAEALSDTIRRGQLLDLAGVSPSTGSGAAYSVILNSPLTALVNGTIVGFRPNVPNTGPVTLTVTGSQSGSVSLGAAPLRAISGQDLSAGDLAANNPMVASYSATSFSKAITGTLTNGSTQITGVADTAGIAVGQAVTSTTSGIPASTTVSSIAGSTVTLSAAFAGTTTSNASITMTGAEWLLLQGSLLATAVRILRSTGMVPALLSTSQTLDGSLKGRFIQATGSITLTLAATTALGSGWFAYLTNAGSGDVALQTPSAVAFTASATQGSTNISSISNTNGLAIGQRVVATIPAVTLTGTLTSGASAITAPSSVTTTFAGQTVSAAGLPTGSSITGIVPNTVTFTGSTQSGVFDIDTVSSLAGLVVGAVVTGTGIAPGSTIIGAYTGSIGGNTGGNFVRLSQPATSTGSSITITQPQQIVLSSTYTGTTAAGVTITVSGGKPLPDGTTIAGLTGTSATLSAPWAAPIAIGASFTAYNDNVDGLTGYVVYPGETRLLVCDGISTVASRVLTPFQFTASTSRFFTMPPGYGGVGLDGIGAGGGGGGAAGFPGTGGAGGGRLPPMRLGGIVAGTLVPILVGAGGAPGAAGSPGSAGGNTSFGSYLSFGGGGAGNAGSAGGMLGGAGGGDGAIAAISASSFAMGGAGGAAGLASSLGAEWGGAAGGGSSSGGGNSIFGGAGGGSGAPSSTITGGYPGGISGPNHALALGGFNGSAGTNGAPARSNTSAGDGGGGGGGNGSGLGGSGGAGGYPGGGGGGGGPGSTAGGIGGAGAAGLLRVWGI